MIKTNYQALREAAVKATWGDWDSYKPHRGARGYEVRLSGQAIAKHVLKTTLNLLLPLIQRLLWHYWMKSNICKTRLLMMDVELQNLKRRCEINRRSFLMSATLQRSNSKVSAIISITSSMALA